MLGELEQLVILAVLRSGRDAYAVSVQSEIASAASRDVMLATIHKTLSRLEEKGLVSSRMGDPTPQRGGRRRRHFSVTAAGKRELSDALNALRRMSRGVQIRLDPS